MGEGGWSTFPLHLRPLSSVCFPVCIYPPWLSRTPVPISRPVPRAPISLQSVWLSDHLVKRSHQLVKMRPLGTVLLPSV